MGTLHPVHRQDHAGASVTRCSLPDCPAPTKSRSLCHKHYQQARRKGELAALPRQKRPSSEILRRDELGRKQCCQCGQWLPTDKFYAHSGGADGLRPDCVECGMDNEVKRRHLERLRRYGITQEKLDELIVAQGGECAICCTPFDECVPPGYTVDHDHACCPAYKTCCGNCVRGLLCRRCNGGLGSFGDSVENLQNAIAYLASVAKTMQVPL